MRTETPWATMWCRHMCKVYEKITCEVYLSTHHLSVANFCFLESHVHASRSSGQVFNFVHSSRPSWPILSIHHNPLDQLYPCIAVFWTSWNRLLDKAPTNGIVFVWRNSGSGPRHLVCASLGFSRPVISETRIFPERAWCCKRKSPNSQMSDFSQSGSVDHPNCCGRVRFDCHMATQTEVVQNWMQSHTFCCCPHHCCQFGLSTAQGQDSHSLGPRFHELATPHRNTSHCRFSHGVASSKVCITKHLNIIVQLGPWISAGHSRVFDRVSCNSPEGSEVLCAWRSHFPH